MSMNNLIIGGYTNYDWDTIRPWVLSIEETCDHKNTDKVAIVGNTTQEALDNLTNLGWDIVPMVQGQPHVVRFISIYNYLKDNWQKYDYVITTDVRDVIFQSDPFVFVDDICINTGTSLVCGSESIRYRDEPWGNENLLQCYGEYIHSLYKDKEIFNVGVLAGSSDYVRDLALNIALNSVNRPIPIVDQAVFNMMINTQPYIDSTYGARQHEGWVCHAGTTADPINLPRWKDHLLEDGPVWKDGKVYNYSGERLFAIVHQYDRVPEWNEEILKRYS